MKLSLLCFVLFVTNYELSEAKPLDAADDLVVTLLKPQSKVRGHVLKSYLGIDYYGFQDIPYAVPPVGKFRFQDPSPHPGWEGILNATSNSKVCAQMRNGQEDCLILNVYTPVKPGTGKLPVFFWVHGGAFVGGSCTLQRCNPEYYMDHQVIVVTIHYRVGPFGFLTTEDGVIPGNVGLKDQLLALKWVNKNIAAFGGDPTKITIGGQSAGAISISAQVLSQKATGLYRAAVIESGTALVHGSYISTARDYAFQMGKLLEPSFNSSNSQDLLKVLQSAPLEAIQQVSNRIKPKANQVGILDDLLWGLVVEKHDKDPFLSVPFDELLRAGKFDKVPLLIGYASEESLSFTRGVNQVVQLAAVYDKNSSDLVYDKLNIPERDVPIVGEQIKKIYTSTSFSDNLAGIVELSSDIGLINPTIRQAALSGKHVPVYLYEFRYEGVGHDQRLNITNVDGCGHGEDLTYLWPRRELVKDEDKQMSKVMLKLWTNFIHDLNPTPSKTDPILGDFQWQRVTNADNVEYAGLNKTLSNQKAPKRYKAIKELFEKYAKPPYVIF